MNRSTPLFALGAALTVACATQPPAAVGTAISAPVTAVAGTSFSATVMVVDATGKVVPGFVGGVALNSSDANAQLPAQYVFTAADRGMHIFSVELETAGTQSLTATAPSLPGVGKTQLLVTAGAAASFALTAPATAVSGTPFSAVLTASDAFHNLATGYTGTVALTSNDAHAQLPAAYTFTASDAGGHTFSVSLEEDGVSTLTATDSATATLTASATVTVGSGAAASLQITGLAANAVAGVEQALTITAYDAAGNVATGYLGAVTLTTTDGEAVLAPPYTFTPSDQGVHQFSAAVAFHQVGPQTVTGSDGTLNATAQTQVGSAAAASLLLALPQAEVAGVALDATVTALDAFGNIATGYSGQVAFAGGGAQATLPAATSFTAADAGVHHFPAMVTLRTAGAQVVSVADSQNAQLTASSQVVVSSAAAASMHLIGLPQTTVAGLAQSGTVTALDAFGNIATGYLGTVTFTATDAQAMLPATTTFLAADSGTHAFASGFNLRTAGAQTITVADVAGLSAQANLTVTPAAAASLTLTLPQTEVAGVAIDATATAFDAFGNIATGYLGIVAFSSGDAQSTLPDATAFAAADAGVHAFPAQVTLRTSGSQTVTVTDSQNSALTASSQIAVAPAAAASLQLTGLPQTAVAGVALSGTVLAFDAFGNIATGYTGSVSFKSTDRQASLPAATTFSVTDSGTHAFPSGFALRTVGSVTIQAIDGASLTAQSTVLVTPAAASTLLIGNLPTETVSLRAADFNLTMLDPFGNIATGYLGTIQFTSTDSAAVVPADYTFLATDAGVHSFPAGVAFAVAGNQTLTATDTVNASITGSAATLVGAGGVVALQMTGLPASVVAGALQKVTVTALDAANNIVTGYLGTVAFSSTDSKAVFAASYQYLPGDAGAHFFNVAFGVAGAQTLSVTDGQASGQQSTLVLPGAALSFAVSGLADPETAGVAQGAAVTALDAFGNIAVGYLGTVAFTSTDPLATLPGNYSFIAADEGVHAFPAEVVLRTAALQALTVTDLDDATIGGAQRVLVDPAAASGLLVAGFPSSQVAGVSASVSVTAEDTFGNIATGYRGTIKFTSSDLAGVLPANYAFLSGDAGVHTFSATLKTVSSNASLIATDTVTSSIAGKEIPITITPAAAASLAVAGFPASQVAGVAGSFTVTAKDAFGNIATGYRGTIKFSSNDIAGILPSNYTFLPGDLGAHGFSATLKTANSAASLSATDTATSGISGTQSPIAVTPAAAATLAIAGFPASQVAGVAGGFTVTAKDSFGNIATGYAGSIKLTSSDAAAVLPGNYPFTSGDEGVHSFSATLKTVASSASITATDTVTATITGKESPIAITPAPAASFALAGFPGSQVAGVASSFTVTAKDAYGNIAAGYLGSVKFSSSDGAAALPGNYPFVSGDAGAHTFSATLKTVAAAASLTATDTVTASITGTESPIAITPAAATALVVAGFPASQIAGAAGSFTVTAKDAFGNIATGYTGTVKFSSSDAAAVLPGNYPFVSGDAGVHSFSATLKTVATAASLTATDATTSTITGTQSPISLTPATASILVVAGFPASQVAGIAGSFSVTAKDPYGNIATGYLGTVHFTSSDAAGILPVNYPFVSGDAGVHSFSATLKTVAGSASITGTDTVTATITGTDSPIAIKPSTATVFTVAGFPASEVAGTAGSFTVTAKDAFGNIATGYVGTAHFTSSDSLGLLPVDYTFIAGDSGVHAFSATLKTVAASASITATDTVTSSITGSDSPIAITPAGAATLVVAGFTTPQTAGTAGSFSVTAKDPYGNIATGYTGTVHFTSNNAGATLPGNYLFGAGDAGVHSFSATLITVATLASLTATDTATATISGTQSPIVIKPATASILVVAGFPASQVAGIAGSFSVTAKDPYGNIATGYLGTVHFTSSDAAGILPVNYPFVSGDAGVHSFSATLKTVAGSASITGTDTVTATITGTDSPIAIKPSTATVFTVAGFPASEVAGTAGSFTVTAKDAFGNIATGYVGTAHFTSSDSLGLLPVDYTFIAGDSGVHAFSATLKTVAASASITATDTVTSSITGSDSPIAITPAGAATLVVAGFTTPQTAGTAGSFSVTAKDPYGNIATGYTGTVHFTSNNAGATLPGNYLFGAGDAGVHSFSATLITVATLASLTATDTATATISGTQSPIVIKPATASILVVAGFPASQVAGIAGSFSVTAKDPYGNIATGYLGTVHFTSSDAAGILPVNYPFVSGDAGVHSFSATLKTVAGSASITGTDTVTATITGTDSPIAIKPSTATVFTVAGFPASEVAGTAGSFTVTAKDAFGNIATGYVGTAHFTSSDSLGLLPVDYTFIAGDSGVHAFSATLKTVAASASITATDTVTSSITGSDSPIAITPAGAATLVVAGFTTPQTAGTAGSFSVTAKDPYGNIATGYTGTVHFTSNNAGATLPGNYLFGAGDAGVHSFSATLITVATQASLTATDTATATISGTQSPIVIKPATANILVVAGFPSTEAAGTASTFTVTARDPYGNIATGYLGTVHFTSSDAAAVLPADYHYVAGDSGAHTFSATLKTVASNASLTATDKATSTITGTESPINITPASGTILVVAGFPETETAGVAGNFSVTAMDAFGNIAKGYLGTVHFTSSDAAALLPADYTFAAANQGTASFSATLKTAASDTSLTTTDTSNSSIAGTQAPIAITPAAASTLSVAGFPSPQVAGTAGSFTVTAKDPYGNIATGYTGTIHFVSSDAQGVLPSDYPFAAVDQGQQIFSATLKTVNASASLSATDTLSGSINGTDSPIAITPAGAKTLAVTGFPASVVAGTSNNFTVTAKDPYGNTATGYTGTIKLTSSDGQAALPANYAFVSTDAGARSFAATLKTVATLASLTATDTATSTITGSESPIAVAPANASSLTVMSFPASVVAGTSNSFTVTAKDPYGNTAIGYLGTIKLTSSDAAAALPANYTFLSGDHGVHSLSATLKTAAASASLTATDTIASTITGTESPIAVTPAGASLLVVAGFPSPQVAGTAGSFTVTAKDPYGNIATAYTGTIKLTSSDAAASLPANYTFVSGNAGVQSFSATLVTVASNASLTATDQATSTINGSQTGIAITPAAAKTLGVAGFPASVVAGSSNSFTVIAKDQYGNTATGYTGTIKLTSSDTQALLPVNYTFLSTDAGVRSFAATLKTVAASVSLTATDTVTATITGTESPIAVTPAAASSLAVTSFPVSVVAGTSNSFTVTAKDPYGNTATGYVGTIKLTSSDAAAILPVNYTFLSTDAGARGFTATLKTVAATASLTATDTVTSTITGSESPIAVTPANASLLLLAGFPSPQIAGTAGTFTVIAKDPYGNIATGYRGTIAVTSNDGASTVLPTNYAFAIVDAGVHSFSATLKTVTSAGSITATDTATSTINGSQTGIVITPATAVALTVAGFPASVVAGTSNTFTVTAKDQYGNIAAGYVGTIKLTSSDAAAVLPANYTFLSTDAGVRSFAATLKTVAPSASLTATDTATSTITGTESPVAVTPAGASSLAVTNFPASVVAGTPNSFTVTAKDPYGNTATGYAGTIKLTSSDAAALLPANYTFLSTDAGAHSFSATLKMMTTSASLTATDIATPTITGSESPIAVTPANASLLVVAGFPSSQVAGVAGSFTVTAKDPYGNTASGYRGTVVFTSNDGASTALPTNYAFLAVDSGVHSFSATLKMVISAGSITATDTATSTITGTQSPIVIGPATAVALTVAGFPSPQIAGVAGNFTVTAIDGFGNVATGYRGTIRFSSSDTAAALPGTHTFTATDAGVHGASAILTTVTTQASLTATDTTTSTITGTQSPIAITPAAASRFIVANFPSPQVAGAAGVFTVTAKDPYGNTVTGYLGTVHFTSTDAQGVLPASYSFLSADAGVHSFNATLKTVNAAASINATDTSSITGAQSPIQITPATASNIAYLSGNGQTGSANTVLENPLQAIVTDPYSNPIGSYTVTWTVQSGSAGNYGNANTLSESTTTASNGVATTSPAPTVGVATGTDTFLANAVNKTTGAPLIGSPVSYTTTSIPGPIYSFSLTSTAGAPQTPGVAFNVTATALDQYGNTITTYVGPASVSTSDPKGTVPASISFAGGSGVKTFAATLDTASTETITVSDSSSPTATGSITIRVGPAVAISPPSLVTAINHTATFSATGGVGSGYVYSLTTNGSGGSVNASTGAYLSGPAVATDVVTVKDTFGNSASATITVNPRVAFSTASLAVVPRGSATLGATGGVTPYTFSFASSGDRSGGSVTTAGAYVAGAPDRSGETAWLGELLDNMKVTDALGDTATMPLKVTAGLVIGPWGIMIAAGDSYCFGYGFFFNGSRPSEGFYAQGGSGTGYTFSLISNQSGASINATSGCYAAGSTLTNGRAVDTIQVTDSLGNVYNHLDVNVISSYLPRMLPLAAAIAPQASVLVAEESGGTLTVTNNESGGTLNASTLFFPESYSGGIDDGISTAIDTLTVPSTCPQIEFCAPGIGTAVVLPGMLLSPLEVVSRTAPRIEVYAGDKLTFTTSGGAFAGYSYALTTNNSGGSIDAASGTYIAGSTTGVLDTVTVTDAEGATTTGGVEVLAKPAGLYISPANVGLLAGGEIVFHASGGTPPYTFSTPSNSIDAASGFFRASVTRQANTTATVTDSLGATSTANIYVWGAPAIASTETSPLYIGDTSQFTASGGAYSNYEWYSTNPAFGWIDRNTGYFECVGAGSLTIYTVDFYGNEATFPFTCEQEIIQ